MDKEKLDEIRKRVCNLNGEMIEYSSYSDLMYEQTKMQTELLFRILENLVEKDYEKSSQINA